MSLIAKLIFHKKQNEKTDIFTFYFKHSKGLKFKAGQHGLFILPGLYRPYPFSISSSPDEDYVTISTHVGSNSRYKNRLLQLEENDTMLFVGPLFNFTFQKNIKEYVFLAQGVGITPFRSMLTYAKDRALQIDTTLIHVESSEHLFKSLTSSVATTAIYPTSPEEFKAAVVLQDPSKAFYISGSPKFISATKKVLSEHGVLKRNIKTDPFYSL
jgi:ferredoxin-NADP reductase